MGTRSTTAILEGAKGSPILCKFYRQFDGYISGHGFDMKKDFGNIIILNGFGDQKAGEYANGMGCFAAQLISKLKSESGIGGIYMSSVDDSQEYDYTLYEKDGKVWVTVETGWKDRGIIYDGPLSELTDVEQ